MFRYDDPANPGYLTRRILRGTNGGLRIAEAREYDAYGNLARSWEGDESPTGPNAVGLTVYNYPDPWNATERNVTDPLGVLTTTAWRRDPDSNVPLVTSSSGDCSTCGVDPPGFASQDKTTFTYDAARGDQLPLSRTDPLIGATTFDYDALNRRTRVTDVNGVPTETTYDNLDRVTAVILKGATAARSSFVCRDAS